MYRPTFIRGINIHVCQTFVNLRGIYADYVQLTNAPFLGDTGYSTRILVLLVVV